MQRKILTFFLCALLILACLSLPAGAETFSDGDLVYTYERTEENTARLLSITGANPWAGVTIPREVDGIAVTSIGPGFLQEDLSGSDLAQLFIPNTVTEIDPNFLSGINLYNMNAKKDQQLLILEEGNPVYTYLFDAEHITGCLMETDTCRVIAIPERRSKTLAIAPGAKILGAYALVGLTIDTLSLPASLVQIEDGALSRTKKITYVELDDDNPVFSLKKHKLWDDQGNVIYPPEKNVPPETKPLTPEQIQHRQEEEQTEFWITVLGIVLIVALLLTIIFVIWHSVRGYGAMSLREMFSQPQLFFFDIVLCGSVLLIPQLLEEAELLAAGNELALAGLIVCGVVGVIWIAVEIITSLGWSPFRILFKLIPIVAAIGLSLTGSFLGNIMYVIVGWRIFSNAARGAWSIFCGLGLAPVFELLGDIGDAIAEDMPLTLVDSLEVKDLSYSDPTHRDRVFVGPNGSFLHLRETPYSDTAQVKYNGKTYTATRIPGGQWQVHIPSEAPVKPQPVQKVRKRLKIADRLVLIGLGIGRLAPALLLIVLLLNTVY